MQEPMISSLDMKEWDFDINVTQVNTSFNLLLLGESPLLYPLTSCYY